MPDSTSTSGTRPHGDAAGAAEPREATPRVLVIADEPAADAVRSALAGGHAEPPEVAHARRLGDALRRLVVESYDAALLVPALPDGAGLGAVLRIREHASGTPLVVLGREEDEALALEFVRAGAQDFLRLAEADGSRLPRAIRFAIERHRRLMELRAMALVDGLTGLYNRRGFRTLAEQQLKLAHRTASEMLILFADVDGMKWINDTLGHAAGDQALIESARLLRETFRDSDILARIGGDEFVVLALASTESDLDALHTRLRERLDARNLAGDRRYSLSISLGFARYDPRTPCSIDDLLARADRQMYEDKRRKANPTGRVVAG